MTTVERKYPCLDKISTKQIRPQGRISLQGLQKLKAAFKISAIWPRQSVLNIAFLDGSSRQRNWVQHIVKTVLEPICSDLVFKWSVPVKDSNMRISFALPGQAWSYVGTECLTIPKNEPTMNLGWIDDDVQFDSPPFKNTGQVVIHEFCHALGMIHEHQNPKNNQIVWNKPVVYAELKRTNGWSKEQVDVNLFQKYGDKTLCEVTRAKSPYEGQDVDIEGYCNGSVINGSEYDMHSIMHYWYPSKWVLEGPKELPLNTKLSDLDREWLAKYYGKQGSVLPPPPPAPTSGDCPPCDQREQQQMQRVLPLNCPICTDAVIPTWIYVFIIILILILGVALYVIYSKK